MKPSTPEVYAAASDWRNGGFGLYIHWPYCSAKCPYCDFNSHVAKKIDHAAWRRAYSSEISRASTASPDRVLSSIFIGGGTPSLMEPETVKCVLDAARHAWPFANNIEITLEANPTSAEADRLEAFRQAGINRLSIGVQSLRNDSLRQLGRMHDADDALGTVKIARALFERVSFDIIYARQFQDQQAWSEELTEILALRPDHLSLYQLTIEDGTAFGSLHAKKRLKGLPNEDRAADLFELTQALCAAAGLDAYEVSNHSRPGSESLHNLIYWRYGDFLGIGPGAHGRITLGGQRFATETMLQPQAWLDAALGGTATTTKKRLIPELEQAEEMLMMGLRLSEGINLSRYVNLAGVELDRVALNELNDLGLTEETNDRILCSAKGRPLLNAVIRRLLV